MLVGYWFSENICKMDPLSSYVGDRDSVRIRVGFKGAGLWV